MTLHVGRCLPAAVTCPGERGWSHDHPLVLSPDTLAPQGTDAMPGDIFGCYVGVGVPLASSGWSQECSSTYRDAQTGVSPPRPSGKNSPAICEQCQGWERRKVN